MTAGRYQLFATSLKSSSRKSLKKIVTEYFLSLMVSWIGESSDKLVSNSFLIFTLV